MKVVSKNLDTQMPRKTLSFFLCYSIESAIHLRNRVCSTRFEEEDNMIKSKS